MLGEIFRLPGKSVYQPLWTSALLPERVASDRRTGRALRDLCTVAYRWSFSLVDGDAADTNFHGGNTGFSPVATPVE